MDDVLFTVDNVRFLNILILDNVKGGEYDWGGYQGHPTRGGGAGLDDETNQERSGVHPSRPHETDRPVARHPVGCSGDPELLGRDAPPGI